MTDTGLAVATLATIFGLGFTSGLNLYATVFATGLALRLHWIALPPTLHGLAVLASPPVLVIAGLLYTVEFVADKVPVVEHAWDLVHSFIRPLGACWIAWQAVHGVQVDPSAQVLTVLLVGGVALTSHLSKAGGRVLASSVGGHFFGLNAFLSFAEDVVSLVVAPLAIAHPMAALAIACVGLAGGVFLIRRGVRFLRSRRRVAAA